MVRHMDIFEIEEAVQLTVNRWSVIGRAWETIEKGETVYAAPGRTYQIIVENNKAYSRYFEPEEGVSFFPFRITSILIFKREMSQLDRGVTGELLLEGEHGDTLKKTLLLVRPSP